MQKGVGKVLCTERYKKCTQHSRHWWMFSLCLWCRLSKWTIGRFHCLHSLRAAADRAGDITVACCVLHAAWWWPEPVHLDQPRGRAGSLQHWLLVVGVDLQLLCWGKARGCWTTTSALFLLGTLQNTKSLIISWQVEELEQPSIFCRCWCYVLFGWWTLKANLITVPLKARKNNDIIDTEKHKIIISSS